jgi:hypothetical protein
VHTANVARQLWTASAAYCLPPEQVASQRDLGGDNLERVKNFILFFDF